MRAEELLETLTDEELKKRANGCFIQAENTDLYQQVGAAERQRLLTEANFYLSALSWRSDARVARRDFLMEIGVMVLIGVEIVLSVIGLRAGYEQSNILDKQTTALIHMDTSTAATSDLLQKLVAAQNASLNILQQGQAERAKKPKLALYVGNISLDRASVHPQPLPGRAQTVASLDLLMKNEGEAPVSTYRLHAVLPKGVGLFSEQQLTMVPESEAPADPRTNRVTLQLPLLPAGETIRIHTQIVVPNGYSRFKIPFTVDALELRTVAPLGSLTVIPPEKNLNYI